MSSFPLGAACTVLFSFFLALPAAANQQDPFWVVSHSGLLSTRLDPVLSPGGVSSHVHQIIGTSSFLPTYTYENNQLGKCTTANVGADKSSYWAPQMYYKWDNGTYSVMPLGYANTYYQVRRMNNEPMHAFPKGFRMLAGNANRNTYNQWDPTNAAVSYVCLGGTQPQQEKFPTEQCKDGLRAQVYFPHCWDGVNNWLPGSAHVSYGQTGAYDQGGQCPPTHPKRIMGLFYEFIYQDNAPYRPNGRVLANGDTVGYSFHGDFVNGWPVGLFEEIWGYGTQCDVGFSIEKCPPLARTKHTSGDGNGGDCKPEGLMVDEPIGFNAPIASLPGSNPLWGGPSSPRPSSSSSSSGSDAALSFISAVGKWKSGRLVGPDNVQLNASGLVRPTPGSTAGVAVGSGDGADPNAGVKVGGDGTWTDVYAGVETPTGGVQSSQTTSASRGGGQEGSTGSLSGTGKTEATTTSSGNTGTVSTGTTTTRATTPASASSTASVRTSASTSAKAGTSGSGSSVPSGGNLLASPTTSSASPVPTHSESSSSSMASSTSHLDSTKSLTPNQSDSVTAPASMASATSHTKHKHQHHTHTAQQKVTSTADAPTVVPTTTGSGAATAGSKTCVSGSNEKRDGMKRRRAGKGRRRSRI